MNINTDECYHWGSKILLTVATAAWVIWSTSTMATTAPSASNVVLVLDAYELDKATVVCKNVKQ